MLDTGLHATLEGIRRPTRKQHSAEEKIRIVLAGLRGEDSIAEHCRREGSLGNLTPTDVYFGRGQAISRRGRRSRNSLSEAAA